MGVCSIAPTSQYKVKDSSWYKKDIKFIVSGNPYPLKDTKHIVDVVGAVVWVSFNIKGAVVWALEM